MFSLARTTSRSVLSFPRSAARPLSTAAFARPAPSLSLPSRPALPLALSRRFSAAPVARSAAASDGDLVRKLAEELKYERATDGAPATKKVEEPEFLKAFKQKGVWNIEETPGQDEVSLTRKLGNEHIKVTFSISDLNNSDPYMGLDPNEGDDDAPFGMEDDAEPEEDFEIEDDEDDYPRPHKGHLKQSGGKPGKGGLPGGKRGFSTSAVREKGGKKGGKGKGKAIEGAEQEVLDAEEDLEPVEDVDMDDDEALAGMDDDPQGHMVRVAITITKPDLPNQGALMIDASASDGVFVIDQISFYPDASLVTTPGVETDWKRRGMYVGPQFAHLDLDVQGQFDSFLEERGIDGEMASFIPDLAEWKEQKEYVTWLESVRGFIEA